MRRLLIIAFCCSYAFAVPALVRNSSGTNTFVSTGHQSAGGGTSYTIGLPDAALSGNCVVLGFAASDNGSPAITVTDDKGGTWTQGPTAHDSANARLLQLWYSAAVTGARRVTVNFNGAFKLYLSGIVAEFYNTSCVADGGSGNTGTGTNIQAGSFSPSTTGDLVVQYGINDTDDTVSSFTAGSQGNISWDLMSADVVQGNSSSYGNNGLTVLDSYENAAAVQWGVYNSTSALNPQMTQSGGSANGYVSVALALKSSGGGSDDSSALVVRSIQHLLLLNGTTSPMTVQFPCRGHLLVAAWVSGSGDDITSIADSNGNAWIATGPFVSQTHNYRVENAVCSSTMKVTLTFNQTFASQGNNVFFYDIDGSGSVGATLDRDFATTGNQGSGGNLTGASVTPTNSLGIVIGTLGVALNGPNGTTGAGQVFDSVVWGNEPVVSSDPTAFSDELGGWAHYFNTSTATVTFVWTEINTTDCNCFAGDWSSRATAFKAGASTGTVLPPTMLTATVR